jgi:hypothetical protein
MNRIMQVFSDVHLGQGHKGLGDILKKEIGRTLPKEGELFVFINKAKSAAKVFAQNSVLFYVKPVSGKLEMASIIELPRAIGANGTLNYSKALELALRKKIK